MMTATTTPGTIVVAYDGSHHADQALIWAADQAALEGRTLTIAHVVKTVATLELGPLAMAGMVPGEVQDAIRSGARTIVADARARALDMHRELDVACVVDEGDPRQILLGYAADAHCLVLGSRGRGRIASLLLGSVSVALARHASCPVVVVRPFHPGAVRNGILVGTDGGDRTLPTLEFAYRQASIRHLPLTVVHCVPGPYGEEIPAGFLDDDEPGMEDYRCVLSESVAGMTEKFPDVPVRLRLGHGFVDRCLVTASASMDLVVVGHHHGPSGGDVLGLGSFAPAVVEGASCPVAIVGEARDA